MCLFCVSIVSVVKLYRDMFGSAPENMFFHSVENKDSLKDYFFFCICSILRVTV